MVDLGFSATEHPKLSDRVGGNRELSTKAEENGFYLLVKTHRNLRRQEYFALCRRKGTSFLSRLPGAVIVLNQSYDKSRKPLTRANFPFFVPYRRSVKAEPQIVCYKNIKFYPEPSFFMEH